MKVNYKDFIGMYENVYPDGFCEHMIAEFERIMTVGSVSTRKEEGAKKHEKEDFHYFLNSTNHDPAAFNGQNSMIIFWDGLQKCFDMYSEKFDVLQQCDLRCSTAKIQRTDPGAGYHVWHAEQGSGIDVRNRAVVYSLYLNTLDNDGAGETEYLYQQLRIPPKENCMVLWPATYTHPHRGNVVHGNKSKYIITGWFYYE